MDYRIRELERKVLDDPNLRGPLMVEYIRTGAISRQAVDVCASLGHSEAVKYSEVSGLGLSGCLQQNLPKKVYLALGLGAVLGVEAHLGETIDSSTAISPGMNNMDIQHGIEELEKLITSCRVFRAKSIPAIFDHKGKEEVIALPGYRIPLSPFQHAHVIRTRCEEYVRRSNYTLASADHIQIPRYLNRYFAAHLALGRALNKKPGQRIRECVDYAIASCVHGDEPELWLNVSEALQRADFHPCD